MIICDETFEWTRGGDVISRREVARSARLTVLYCRHQFAAAKLSPLFVAMRPGFQTGVQRAESEDESILSWLQLTRFQSRHACHRPASSSVRR